MSTQETALATVKPETNDKLMEVLKQPPQSAKVTRLASFTPANLTEAIALAKLMSRSELVPKEYRNKPENVLIGMQFAAELGIPPLLGLQNISIINGRASVWGDLFLALIQTSPAYEWHKEYFEGADDNFGAVCIMKRKGQEQHAVKFSVADAKKAGLWGKDSPWRTSPKRMLQMRARGFAGRDKFSDALKGLIIAEEAMDIPVDTSEAKKVRENATLDIETSVASLSESSQPNRGHEDTGLNKQPPSTQTKPAPKEEPTMCSECREIGKHKPDCKYAAQDAKTSKPTNKDVFLVISVEQKKTKKGGKYLIVEAVDRANNQGKLYVWHESFFEYLEGAIDKNCMFEYSAQLKDGKTFHQIEHLLEVGGVKFVNDKPAVEGEMPATAEREPGEDEDF